ncbi:terminase small subunit [Rosistilla oblonga]|uniref:terminase small subunit n=1 Tax=Rosistilla oblonga TaxID=2527990 RepID=UPI003A9838B0
MKLTPKQQRFVEEYLVDLNVTQAAIRAGYSEKTAYAIGHKLLKNAEIQEATKEAINKRSERTGVTQDRVLAELAKIGFQDIRKAVRWGRSPVDQDSTNADPNGLGIYPIELVPSDEIDDDTAVAVSEVSLTQNGVKIKMHDKQAALVSMGRHLGMFTDRTELSGHMVQEIRRVVVDPKE